MLKRSLKLLRDSFSVLVSSLSLPPAQNEAVGIFDFMRRCADDSLRDITYRERDSKAVHSDCCRGTDVIRRSVCAAAYELEHIFVGQDK